MPARVPFRVDDVCFVHWPVESDALAPHLPPDVDPATRDGTAWLSILGMTIRPRFLTSGQAYGQLNVRTYVEPAASEPPDSSQDGPLVYFLDIVIDSAFAAVGSGRVFGYPARYGGVDVDRNVSGLRVEYSPLLGDGFTVEIVPEGSPHRAEVGSLDEWLVERYAYLRTDGDRDAVEHEPWRIQPADGVVLDDALARSFAPITGEPRLQYSPGRVIHV